MLEKRNREKHCETVESVSQLYCRTDTQFVRLCEYLHSARKYRLDYTGSVPGTIAVL